jgi:hypothetical protein
MRLFTDESFDHQKALLISDNPSVFSERLLRHLKKHTIKVSYHSKLKQSFLDSYDYSIFIKERIIQADITAILSTKNPALIIVNSNTLFLNLQKIIKSQKYSHIKVALVDFDDDRQETIENIIWFFLSHTSLQAIDLHTQIKSKKKVEKQKFQINITRKQAWKIGITLFILIEFFFIIPLIGAGFFIYQAGNALQKNDVENAQINVKIAEPFLLTTKASYAVSKPVLLFFLLSLVPENIINIEDNSLSFIKTGLDTQNKVKELSGLFLKTSKSKEEIDETRVLISQVNGNLATLSTTSGNLKDLLDYPIAPVQDVQKKFDSIHEYLETFRKLANHSDRLIGGSTSKKYLVFFYNNMELRPGGGFIGSFAVVEFKNYSLYDFKVYDVYDADGQLDAHVEPPKAIRAYLQQPHWFLRDSNFTPDFVENVETAEFFLDKELKLNNFDGYAAITTTGLTYLLKSFGEIYIPDFNETITADNFYLKAQLQSENSFFPGSIQKKSYLSTVGRTILINIEKASPTEFTQQLKKALDEKQIVFLSKDPKIQQDLDSLRWSGKISEPQCLSGLHNCIINNILSVDANLGVNKANYFINKSIHLDTKITKDGVISNSLSTSFTNNSPSEIFPGGTYKNYYQLYLPHDSKISSIDIDGETLHDFDETLNGSFKIVGILLNVKPKTTNVVTVNYVISTKITQGALNYQLVIQKQIGSFNNDFSFEMTLPDNIFVTHQNFTSLAKKGQVVYNTDLSTDRIFVIDMVRE